MQTLEVIRLVDIRPWPLTVTGCYVSISIQHPLCEWCRLATQRKLWGRVHLSLSDRGVGVNPSASMSRTRACINALRAKIMRSSITQLFCLWLALGTATLLQTPRVRSRHIIPLQITHLAVWWRESRVRRCVDREQSIKLTMLLLSNKSFAEDNK